jgi:hypothetical protein
MILSAKLKRMEEKIDELLGEVKGKSRARAKEYPLVEIDETGVLDEGK